MKIKHLLTISIMAILIIPQLSCNKEWAAKVDNSSIVSIDEFEKLYYLQARLALGTDSHEEIDKLANDPGFRDVLNKKRFLENLVAQKILYKKVMADKTIDRDEYNVYMEFTKMQAVNQYYLMNKFKERIMVSPKEIEMIYNQNRSQYARMTADQADNYIRQQVTAERFRQESGRYVQNLMDEHKIDYDGLTEYEKKNDKTSGEAKPEDKPEQNK
jgi:hypothetical protein